MRIFADENVPALVVAGLRAAGHDVSWGCEHGQGSPDIARMIEANEQQRVILTEDKDFADLVVGRGFAAYGLVRFALHGLGRQRRAARLLQAMSEVDGDVIGRLHVIEPSRIRSRTLA